MEIGGITLIPKDESDIVKRQEGMLNNQTPKGMD